MRDSDSHDSYLLKVADATSQPESWSDSSVSPVVSAALFGASVVSFKGGTDCCCDELGKVNNYLAVMIY